MTVHKETANYSCLDHQDFKISLQVKNKRKISGARLSFCKCMLQQRFLSFDAQQNDQSLWLIPTAQDERLRKSSSTDS